MHYELTCTCGAKHAVTVSQAGQSLACSCGNSLAIPTLRGLKELPVAEPTAAVKGRAIDKPTTGRPSIIVGVLVTIFFIALPVAIFYGYSRLRMDTSQTEESERDEAFALLEKAEPVMLSDAWDQYSTTALGPPSKPAFFYVQQKRQQLEMGLAIAAGIALVAGLAAGTLSAGRRQAA